MSRGKECIKQRRGAAGRGTTKVLHGTTSGQQTEGERREDGVCVIWEALKINSAEK